MPQRQRFMRNKKARLKNQTDCGIAEHVGRRAIKSPPEKSDGLWWVAELRRAVSTVEHELLTRSAPTMGTLRHWITSFANGPVPAVAARCVRAFCREAVAAAGVFPPRDVSRGTALTSSSGGCAGARPLNSVRHERGWPAFRTGEPQGHGYYRVKGRRVNSFLPARLNHWTAPWARR